MKTPHPVKTERDSFTIPCAWMSPGPAPIPHTHAGGIMHRVESLELAKRRATASYARMVAHPSAQDTAQTTRDEQDVLCARVDVLNALLQQDPEKSSPLCLEAAGRASPRVCVTYDRLRCEGELELGPMQSTMAWAVKGAEDPVLQLMSAPDNHPPAEVVKGLLDLVRQSAPKKDILSDLHAALALPPPERLVLKSLRGVNAPEHGGHARVYEGLGEAGSGPVPPLYRVVWGALDLDVLEGWQNPSTNAAIRLSILDAAHQAGRDAQQTKAPAWSNVAYLQVRVFHGEECHRLSLRPFWDSESCTVSHLQFKQSVFDDSGPERGLLNLSPDPTTIHPIPSGKILPLQAYVCLGAHRKNRLNEAQLNYVHAQGLLAHGFDTKLLPDAARLLQVQPGKMLPAKATRVSGDKLDVMASSYHVADQVYTTITVVQYPPFGTQFEKAGISKTDAKPSMQRRLLRGRLGPSAGHEPRQAWGDEDDEEEQAIPPQATEFELSKWNKGARPHPGPDRRGMEYKDDRIQDMRAFGNKAWTWDEDLCIGEHFFIDGIYGSPYNMACRFILFEIDNGTRYQQVKTKLSEIRSLMYNKFQNNGWDPDLSFYGNIHSNADIHEIWNQQWTSFLRNHYSEVLEDKDDKGVSVAFWAATNQGLWKLIFYKPEEKQIAQNYMIHQEELQAYWNQAGRLKVNMNNTLPQRLAGQARTRQSPANPDQLPLPQTRLSARSAGKDPVVGQLQSRIAALESQLGRARQDENTQFLLSKVLEKLETVEEV